MNDEYPQWRARLAEANDQTFWPVEVIDAMLAQGEAQFWCDGTSAGISRLVTYPGGAVVLEVLSACGNLESLFKAIAPQLEEFALSHGATWMQATGRLGWRRATISQGWKPEMVLIKKELAA